MNSYQQGQEDNEHVVIGDALSGWEWDEMLGVNHHEGVAAAAALVGVLLYLLPSKKW